MKCSSHIALVHMIWNTIHRYDKLQAIVFISLTLTPSVNYVVRKDFLVLDKEEKEINNFHCIGPTGPISHKVAMSVCLDVCLFVPLGAVFSRLFIGLEVPWSVPGLSLVQAPHPWQRRRGEGGRGYIPKNKIQLGLAA